MTRFVILAAAATVALIYPANLAVAADQPPGAPAVTPAGAPSNVSPVATPARPGRAAVTDLNTPADDDFLKETAESLGQTPPNGRPDLEILRWFGVRPKLETYGITIAANLTLDDSHALLGGLNTRSDVFRDLLDIRMNLDTRAAFGLEGGTFSLDFQNQSGRNGTDIVGDEQGFDNADADGRTQIAELWYQQFFLDNRLRVKVGKVDANSEFAAPQFATSFINSSFGHPPTVTAMPTYPDPATSLNIYVYPTQWLYGGFGVYDGSGVEGTPTGAYGPAKLFRGDPSIFYIAEIGTQWLFAERTLPGRFAVGAHYSSGEFGRFDGTTQSGAGGFYGILEQKIWHRNFYDKGHPGGLYAFLQYGHADGQVSDVTDYIGGGLTWIAPYEKVYPDALGIGFASAHFTRATGAPFTRDFETSVEAFYNFQVTQYLSIKPDLQYIFNPGGDRSIDNALVATLRVVLAF